MTKAMGRSISLPGTLPLSTRGSKASAAVTAGEDLDTLTEGGFGVGAQMDSSVRPYNQRIELSLDDDEDGTAGRTKGGDDDYAGMDDDDELTREKVKRASSQIIAQIDRKKRRPKKSTGGFDD